MAVIWRHANEDCTTAAPFAGHPCLATMHPPLRWFRSVSTRATQWQSNTLGISIAKAILDWRGVYLEQSSCGQRPQSLDHLMHIACLGAPISVALASKKTNQRPFAIGSRPL